MGHLWFIPSHHLEIVDNYNKEKVITTNKITPTTGINETAKMPLLKLFLYFRDNVYNIMNAYIYRTENLNCRRPMLKHSKNDFSPLLLPYILDYHS